jgi:ATP-dependent Clp protease adaptor protein ClpS
MVKEKIKDDVKNDNVTDDVKKLVLHNDDFNHFDFVIRSLVEVCGHSLEQAEQCALITHFRGKCDVKNGTFKELMTSHKELTFRNLTVSIE